MLTRYWLHEPWGSWRDNLHTALLATEIRRPYLKKGSPNPIGDFMLRHPDELSEERAEKKRKASRNLFSMFKSIAKKRPRNG